jgi:hypothetical protein
MPITAEQLALLDSIEALEMRSLEWGYTAGGLSQEDAFALCLDADRADDMLEALIEAKLVFELMGSSGDRRYRSRFAEMMRLLAANRQLFPNRPWQGAPRLVADFRVDRRSRRFPRRKRLPSQILEMHEAVIAPTALRRAIWDALTKRLAKGLAAFQERATVRIAQEGDDGATIVTAGTGSGKTIAFYLPAMLAIGEAISAEPWVKVLAIYPRLELLKDQFGEAFRMAREIDIVLETHQRRPIRIGALFSATPNQANASALNDKHWARHGRDWICPWMRCPSCRAEMLWRSVDLEAARERLYCARPGCGYEANESHIVLTRQRIQKEPPDILFTTTEILNQRLSDHWTRGVFGVGTTRKPFLALLDEVHTYEGTSGAQAALTLRRWRYLLGAPVKWVGLSATLGDAARFFSDLTGAAIERVVEVTPTTDEYDESGAEYQILLRGDPSTRASLLSTTIQTSMLVSRVLDPPASTSAMGAFGRRAFLFTDDLDVTNRLYDDLRDAEAYSIFGQPDMRRQPLATLRAAGADDRIRDLEGQRWRLCEDIGHSLTRRLVIGRTTSQDAGVEQGTNIVVATAALEVGFNDIEVGAVIQHKSPRGMASFLQRKGRAGRTREMRPIMLTILSDYGRDRAFYQSYERLFDPMLEPQRLPIRNPYVLKMQATFALFDWLSNQSSGAEKAWAWDFLSRPLESGSPAVAKVINRVKTKLTQLVQGDGKAITSLREHLMGALCIDEEVAQTLLWEAPRSLLLEAVPTLVRRLFRNWRLAFPSPELTLDFYEPFHPLPDFVPQNLFSDLSLPEVRVLIPPATVNHEWRTESMPIFQALGQLAPGRVTRRFAHERGGLSHWVRVDPTRPLQSRKISEYAEEHEFVGEFAARFNDTSDAAQFLVYRPWTVRLAKADRSEALPTSNARLSWLTDIVANGNPLCVPVPPRSPWRTYVERVDFFLHRFRASVGVRRFSHTAKANIRTLQAELPVTLNFRSDDDRPAAIGFELEVDGVRLDLIMPTGEQVGSSRLSPPLLASSRQAYLRQRFRENVQLPEDLNVFQRDWLFQILSSSLLADAASTNRSIQDVAASLLSDERIDFTFETVMNELFAVSSVTLPDDEENAGEEDEEPAAPDLAGPPNAGGGGRLQQGLALHVARPEIREALRAIAREFDQVDAAAFDQWLRRLTLETVGESMLQACIAAAPRYATLDNLLVDVRDDRETGVATIWITETTLGGAGVLEAFAERFSNEPRVFFDAVEAALAPTDLELVDSGLRRILLLANTDPEVGVGMAQLRATDSHVRRAQLWQGLSATMAKRGGVDLSHALVVSLNNRLLRAGAGPDLDQLLLELYGYWDELEHRFELAIGLRDFAFICSRREFWRDRIRSFLAATVPAEAVATISILAAITTLLWPREAEVRLTSLQSYNPYREVRATDPAVVRHLLVDHSLVTVELGDPDWRIQLDSAFAATGTCRLAAPANQAGQLRAALVRLSATPVDVGVLQFFPVVARVEQFGGRILANLTLREHS